MVILRFHPKERSFPTTHSPMNEGVQWHMPVYYHKCIDQGYEAKIYTFYYKDNLAIGLGHSFFPYAKMLGYHPNDVEFVAVYQSIKEPEDIRVYFSAHSKEGKWYKWEDCETRDDDLIVYVALNSHACYPHAKRYWRLYGLANDVTSKDGLELKDPIYLANTSLKKPLPKII